MRLSIALTLLAAACGRVVGPADGPLTDGSGSPGSIDTLLDGINKGGEPHPSDLGPQLDAVAAAVGCSTERATADRPDQDPDQYQVRVLYVLPSDGADERLDTSGSICRSVQAFNDWLAGQTGGGRRLRFDVHQGRLDIGFVRLEKTDEVMRGSGGNGVTTGYAYVRDRIERELEAMDLIRDRRVYAVYYGGSSLWSCGGGAWPPALAGRVAALYLKGQPPNAVPCSDNVLGRRGPPGYLEFAMIHELMHTLGFVPRGGANEHLAGHAFDRALPPDGAARDLMYAPRSGADPGWAVGHPEGLLLDIGRDDYFEHGRSDIPDLARSVFLSPLPAGAVPPPGW